MATSSFPDALDHDFVGFELQLTSTSEELHNRKHGKPDPRGLHYTFRLFKSGDDTEEQRFESGHVYEKKAEYLVSSGMTRRRS